MLEIFIVDESMDDVYFLEDFFGSIMLDFDGAIFMVSVSHYLWTL